MKFIELIKLKHRAYKYKNKDDQGGILYLLAAIKEGETVLDIGAHKGGYLYFMLKKVGKSGKVYAFEPQRILFTYISQLKVLFKWYNVTVEHLALSDKPGLTTLYIPLKNNMPSPGASIVPKFESVDSTEQVATDTLDNYCRLHDIKPTFLKIDVEGNELNIFKGGIETLRNHMPKILVECEAQHIGKEKVLETFAFLLSLGYKGYFIYNSDFIPLNDFRFEVHQNPGIKPNCNNFIFEV